MGIIASVGLGVMSLPSHFMASPMEEKAYQIMQEELKHDVNINADPDDVVIMSHYAHWNIQELENKSGIMVLGAACFFVLFLLLLIIDFKKGKPTRTN